MQMIKYFLSFPAFYHNCSINTKIAPTALKNLMMVYLSRHKYDMDMCVIA